MSDPVQRFLSRLSDVKKTGNGWSARCPAHDDKNPSLSIRVADDGRLLVHCHADHNCTPEAIVSAVGLQLRDLFAFGTNSDNGMVPRPEARHTQNSTRMYGTVDDAVNALLHQPRLRDAKVTHYDYSGEFVVVRFDMDDGSKSFRPMHKTDAGWVIRDPNGKLPLYRKSEVSRAKHVYVGEGEKVVEAARRIGFVATTSPHGCKSPQNTDWSPLAGKSVVILPDNDAPGRKYADTVAQTLVTLGCQVRIVELPDLPQGGDIVDFIKARDSRDDGDLRRMIEAIAFRTPVWRPAEVTETPRPTGRPAFPVNVLPEPIRSFVLGVAEALGCDPSMVALPALAECAAAVGTTRHVRIKESWAEPCILWCAVVARSGSLKSPALDHALAPMRRLQSIALKAYAARVETYKKLSQNRF